MRATILINIEKRLLKGDISHSLKGNFFPYLISKRHRHKVKIYLKNLKTKSLNIQKKNSKVCFLFVLLLL